MSDKLLVLDDNKDGSLFTEALTGEILMALPLKLFQEALDSIFDFIDSNHDNNVDLNDHFFENIRRNGDKNDDGEVALSEVFGTSLISMPAPIYSLYSSLDKNTDERLTRNEMKEFIMRHFILHILQRYRQSAGKNSPRLARQDVPS